MSVFVRILKTKAVYYQHVMYKQGDERKRLILRCALCGDFNCSKNKVNLLSDQKRAVYELQELELSSSHITAPAPCFYPPPQQNQPQLCESTHDLNRVSIRHIESKGLGYNQG